MKAVLRVALSFLTVRFVLQQFGLALCVVLLFVAWLRLPDSGIAAVAATVLLAILVVALAGLGEASILRKLAAETVTLRDCIRGGIALLLAALLWLAWSSLVDHLSAGDTLYAGYLNSRFPYLARNIFSYGHLFRWLGWMWIGWKWLGAGILVAIATSFVQSTRPVRAGTKALFSLTYWVVLVLAAIIATGVTRGLMGWTPGRGLHIEAVSLAFRLGTVVIVDTLLVCFVLSVITALVSRYEANYEIPDGGPETSHPRTVDMP